MQSFCTVMDLASRYQQSPLDSSSGADWCLFPGQEGVTGYRLSSDPLPISGPNLDSWSWSCPPVARICKLADCIPPVSSSLLLDPLLSWSKWLHQQGQRVVTCAISPPLVGLSFSTQYIWDYITPLAHPQ